MNAHFRFHRLAVPLISAQLVAGCFSAPVPMRSLKYELQPKAKCLVVFLPGAGDTAEAFEQEGFVDIMRQSGLSLDVVAANATLGYYLKGTMRERLPVDVVLPAQKAGGYQQTWVMGMSMGGFGSLFYAQHHVGEIDGVFAMAPYLGRESLAKEIRAQGGLAQWQAPAKEQTTEDNYQVQLWRWLQAVSTGKEPGPQLFVGWGTEDSLGAADEVLGNALPKGHVFTTAGGHDWPPWRVILKAFLAEGTFSKACSADAAGAPGT